MKNIWKQGRKYFLNISSQFVLAKGSLYIESYYIKSQDFNLQFEEQIQIK